MSSFLKEELGEDPRNDKAINFILDNDEDPIFLRLVVATALVRLVEMDVMTADVLAAIDPYLIQMKSLEEIKGNENG